MRRCILHSGLKGEWRVKMLPILGVSHVVHFMGYYSCYASTFHRFFLRSDSIRPLHITVDLQLALSNI